MYFLNSINKLYIINNIDRIHNLLDEPKIWMFAYNTDDKLIPTYKCCFVIEIHQNISKIGQREIILKYSYSQLSI